MTSTEIKPRAWLLKCERRKAASTSPEASRTSRQRTGLSKGEGRRVWLSGAGMSDLRMGTLSHVAAL
jgi:hypothetical protein